MSWLADYIIVGSGLCGVQAAQTLVEKGFSVALLDAGFESGTEPEPDQSFLQHREHDPQQFRIWLGEDLRGLPSNGTITGAQLSPARRKGILAGAEWAALGTNGFTPMESLAKGGLGTSWGLGCCRFSTNELSLAGLPASEMNDCYQVIADRIGIAAGVDDAFPYTMPGIKNLQSPIEADANSKRILARYATRRNRLNKQGFFLGKSSLALLTSPKDGRKETAYSEMEFYANDSAAYRPSITLEQLRTHSNFRYLGGILVTHFEETHQDVTVHYIDITTKEKNLFTCRKLLLAANIMGTARIVLRSSGATGSQIPFLCNYYSYIPCIQPAMLGNADRDPRTATAQLFLFHDPDSNNSNVAMASLYSYQSLMQFRLAQLVPLSSKDTRKLLQYLLPAITIAGIHQPDHHTDRKYLQLQTRAESLTGDILYASATLDDNALKHFRKREKKFMRALRQLRCFPIKKITPPYGASVHYAGSLPYSTTEQLLHLLPDGRLGGTKNVFVADGSGFTFLPAKGLSFSLMANAHRTALNALRV